MKGGIFLVFNLVLWSWLGQTRANETSDRIEQFLAVAMSTEGREFLKDESAVSEALSLESVDDYRIYINRLLSSEDRMEWLLLKGSWRVLARRNRFSSTIASTSIFMESTEPRVVDAMPKIMKGADAPAARGGRWNFSSYESILVAVGWENSERLLSYLYEQSPAAALELTLRVFGRSIPDTNQRQILDRAWEFEEGLKAPGEVLVGKIRLQEFADFAKSVMDQDSIFFSPYIAAVLRRERIVNALPDLRERVESASALSRVYFEEEVSPSVFPPVESRALDDLIFASREGAAEIEWDLEQDSLPSGEGGGSKASGGNEAQRAPLPISLGPVGIAVAAVLVVFLFSIRFFLRHRGS